MNTRKRGRPRKWDRQAIVLAYQQARDEASKERRSITQRDFVLRYPGLDPRQLRVFLKEAKSITEDENRSQAVNPSNASDAPGGFKFSWS